MNDLIYTDETIENDNGIKCLVLDTHKIDFIDAVIGRKSSITTILCAIGDELIVTYNKEGKIESSNKPQKGDAIFCNNETDRYVPRDSSGNAWKFAEIEKYGYEIFEKSKDAIKVKSKNLALLLIGVVKEPSCIKNAWGENSHQFLFEGATLKLDLKTEKITGIDKDAFASTWEVLKQRDI